MTFQRNSFFLSSKERHGLFVDFDIFYKFHVLCLHFDIIYKMKINVTLWVMTLCLLCFSTRNFDEFTFIIALR